MSKLKNDLYLRALARKPTERTPAWMMRQAGRYLPEYLQTRAKAGDFMSLCKNADLACEVTLQPLDRYPLDAAILFSDILTIPDALGLGLYFVKGEGPRFIHPITTEAAIRNLPIIDPTQELGYVMNAVSTITRALDGRVPLIGFTGSPWTLATYMVEGKPSKTFTTIKKMMYQQPEVLHTLLNNLAINVINYLNAQIESGAQAIMIFDTWGGVLGYQEYELFSLNYMTKIIEGLQKTSRGRDVPVTVFTKGGGIWLAKIAQSGCDAVGVDWTVNLAEARSLVGDKVAIQGNLDPSVLYGNQSTIVQQVNRLVRDYGAGYNPHSSEYNLGHIFNLGHGIHQDIPVESPAFMLEALALATQCK